MRCLNDVDVQAVADGEAMEAAVAHVANCSRCGERVESIRRDLRAIAAAVNTGTVPPRLDAWVRESAASQGTVRGSTTLRSPVHRPAWRRPPVVTAFATAAVVLMVVFGVLPRLDSPTTLSASQVLGRSLETLSSATGIEMLEYELTTDGVARGSWRIQLVVDHERPTRYRATTFGPDGQVQAAISQDPVKQRRMQLVRIDNRSYVVDVTPVPNPMLSMPQMAQALAETAITMMQATSDQKLTIVDGPEGRRYVVEVPPIAATSASATLDLHRGRTVVSADDFRIQEFEAAGTLLKQPFAISFRLLQHVVLNGSVPMSPDPFELQAEPGDVVLQGVPSDHPFEELLTTLARELARSRTF